MSCISVNEKYIAVANKLDIIIYDYSEQLHIQIPTTLKEPESDYISDIVTSSDCCYLALITCSKRLIIYEVPTTKLHKTLNLSRSASKIRFTQNNKHILVADKSGDVFIYDINAETTGKKLLGHLSLLLDVLQTPDEKYIITSDRDEKIRVSCYPNTYNIQTYCLGHKEFVNHIELLPYSDKFLLSASGDGVIKLWDYITGTVCYNIDTYLDINDDKLKEDFIKIMYTDGLEVNRLPIVHFIIEKLDGNKSIIAATVYGLNELLIYSLSIDATEINHKLEYKLIRDNFPTDIKFNNLNLLIYDSTGYKLTMYSIIYDGNISLKQEREIKMFDNIYKCDPISIDNCLDSIKVLYKRKFDNVQEYQERKKQRLEKSAQ